MAVYLAKKGETTEALKTAAAIDVAKEREGGVVFKLAISYEIAGNREKALESLKLAHKLGYSEKEIKLEPELVELRADRRYHQLRP